MILLMICERKIDMRDIIIFIIATIAFAALGKAMRKKK